jgi:hypothetical protein
MRSRCGPFAVPADSSRRSPRSLRRATSTHGVSMQGGRRFGAVALALVAMLTSGCATAAFSDRDVRFAASGDTLYLLARSDGVSRNLCASLGGDVIQVEGRFASNEGRTMQIGRVGGCYTIRHVIVCSDGDAGCLEHEGRHKREGAFHP